MLPEVSALWQNQLLIGRGLVQVEPARTPTVVFAAPPQPTVALIYPEYLEFCSLANGLFSQTSSNRSVLFRSQSLSPQQHTQCHLLSFI